MEDKKSTAEKRIRKEIKYLNQFPISNCSAEPITEDNIFIWNAKIKGPKDSPYEGGVFSITIDFPVDYPFKPPRCRFNTPIYHPNINCQGKIDLSILHKHWTPNLTIGAVLFSIIFLLDNPNFDDPLVLEIADIYRDNKAKFEENAKEWTRKCAF